jgi:hypothetical protein
LSKAERQRKEIAYAYTGKTIYVIFLRFINHSSY